MEKQMPFSSIPRRRGVHLKMPLMTPGKLAHGLDMVVMTHGKLGERGRAAHVVDAADAGDDHPDAAMTMRFLTVMLPIFIGENNVSYITDFPPFSLSLNHSLPSLPDTVKTIHFDKRLSSIVSYVK